MLDLKSSIDTQLVQKGRVGRSVWRADDPLNANAARFTIEDEVVGDGDEIAIAISVARAATPDARAYVAAGLPRVGRLITCALPQGPGQTVIAGGGHAAALAEQISNHLREVKTEVARGDGAHLCGRAEQPPVLPRPGTPGHCAMHRL